MTILGETVATGADAFCEKADCENEGPKVCQSAAGYYIGYSCPECGPWSRESVYYPTHELASDVLERGSWGRDWRLWAYG